MKFIEIVDALGNRMAVNVSHIAHMHTDVESGLMIITLSSDRRISTRQFRTINEAVKYCITTTVDVSNVGELK